MADKKNEKRKASTQARAAQNAIQKLSKRMKEIESKKSRLDVIEESLDQIKEGEGEQILIPTGAGIYLKGTIEDTDNMLVEVGSGVIKRKNFEDTKEFLEEKKNLLEKRSEQLQKELARIQKSIKR